MKHRQLTWALICILVLVLPACSRRQKVAVTTKTNSANNAYESGSPASLSNYIRTVLKISQENTVAAEEALRQVHERRPELASLARHLGENNDDLDARKLLAAAYLDEGLQAQAYLLYQEIISISPNDPVAEVGMARVWDGWGDYSLARQHAERAISLDPKSPYAYEALGRIHLHRYELDQAASAFLSALEFAPTNASLLTNLGYTYLTLGNLEQSRKHLERAVEIDGSLAEARNNLGIVLARLGDREGALREFMAANDPATAYNNLGAAYLTQKRWGAARDAFRHALALDPDYSKAQANLAEAELHLPPPAVIYLPGATNEESSAVGDIRPRTVASPDTAEIKKAVSKPSRSKMESSIPASRRFTRATRFSAAYKDALNKFQGRRYRESIEILQWLLQQEPNSVLASNCEYWIGENYFGLGDYNRAMAAFKRVRNYGNSPKARDASLMIKRSSLKQERKARARAS